MWVAAGRIALSLLPKDKLLQFLIFVPLAIVLLFGLLVAAPAGIYKHVPLAEEAQYQFYVNAAAQMKNETGVDVEWQKIIAIDAVLLQQNFTSTSQQRAYGYKWAFVREETITVTCPPSPTPTPKPGKPVVTPTPQKCTKTVYYPRSYEETLQLLINNRTISASQVEDIKDYNKFMISMSDFDDEDHTGGSSINIGGDLVVKIGIYGWPLPAANTRVTSTFGMRIHPITGVKTGHKGVDLAANIGTEVYAIADGTVIHTGYLGTGGETVHIQQENKVVSKYLHLSRYAVQSGAKVKKGDLIAYSGNTGGSTGPHLHLQIDFNGVPINPLRFY